MSRVSEFPHEYGVIGAGALSKSFIGQLPRKAKLIGPVAGVSFRVASRMANSLRAGRAVRNADELSDSPVILFHAPADQVRSLATLLENAQIAWQGRPLIFCDCETPSALIGRFRLLGASAAVARRFGIAGSIMVEGDEAALAHAHRIATALRLKAVEIAPGKSDLFAAAITLSTGALTPLVNRAAGMLRDAGIRSQEAVRMATALFGQTIEEYGYSGRQSWSWHVREPALEEVEAEIAATDDAFRALFRQLVLAGFEDFDKHPEIARALNEKSPVG